MRYHFVLGIMWLISGTYGCNRNPYLLPGTSGQNQNHAITFFVNADCPLCKAYRPFISSLADSLPPDWSVRVIREDLPPSVVETSGAYGLEWGDSGGTIAGKYGAVVTPEVFITEFKTGKLLYRGAIDNYAWETGKHRTSASVYYLLDAVQNIRRGLPPVPSETKATGCFIE